MDVPYGTVKEMGEGEYQLMQEELDRECTPSTFGFGKSLDGKTDVPTLVLQVPLENKEKYVDADIDSGWGLLHGFEGVDALYLDIKPKGLKRIRVRFDKTMIGDMFLEWLELLIKTDGLLLLTDTQKLGMVKGIGATKISLDVPKLILKKGKEAKELAIKFATTLTFTNGICPICNQRIYELNEDKFSISVDISKGIMHFTAHDAKDRQEYEKRCEILGL